MRTILVRYGELTLKGRNKREFISCLISNIKVKLKEYKSDLIYKKDFNSLNIYVINDIIMQNVLEILQKIFGIYSLSIVDIVPKDINKINDKVLSIFSEEHKLSFKVESERKDKSFPIQSPDLKKIVASHILRNIKGLTVDLHNPDILLTIVIKNDGAYIFTNRVKCLGGLPVGITGTGLSLLSGGIDSPVASYLSLKRGLKIDFLHFITPPFTKNESLEKVKDLTMILRKYNYYSFSLYVCDFSDFLNELSHISDDSYRITLMRRAFIKIANLLCKKINAQTIITGESLGQVASQTIESINTINSVSDLPILRPLICYDKSEIIEVSKNINTYQTSILPFSDACSLFVPKNPTTKPKIVYAEKLESEIMFDHFIDYTFKNKIKKMYIDRDGNWNEKQD
ncbi:tRNA uracil 4-sulfurtransferase ThiI [Spiroplasma endosymbiont of Aspidapion aeneum]|uniref:tRNA uracil 4-sulfurtransferase ThiI n=1 Tax=Spiroplasma endosymbiont of Aspidapion aeneum TaxID=3066276 RepID=UPI00313D4298